MSKINFELLHKSFLNKTFKGVNACCVDDVSGSVELKYQILCKEGASNDKWLLLGDDNGPFGYLTKEDADADLERLRKWQDFNLEHSE